MNRKHGVFIYRDRWNGWSLYWDGILIRLGFMPDFDEQIREFCNQNSRYYGFAIGLEGWEL